MDFLEADYAARIAYVDLLCLLHDLLIPLCSEPERRRFPVEEIYRDLENQIHAFSSGREIGRIARENVAAAEGLHSQLSRIDPGTPEFVALKSAVDAFIADLLKQYNLIRVIRAGELELHPA